MGQLSVSVAIGTAVSLLATLLLLLRTEFQGRRPAVVLVRRWIATSARTSTLILALLSAIAISCFASIPDSAVHSSDTSPGNASEMRTEPSASSALEDGSGAGEALRALRAYAENLDANPPSTTANTAQENSSSLPDVDTMIAKLIARLEKQPNDVNGWKMLGWSYLNTGRPDDAATAYETALKLQPGDSEIRKALDAAKSAPATQIQTPANSASGPEDREVAMAEGQSDDQRNRVIRGMVDQLAARLETSPNDESGWLRLMSSRMTLGERDAAKTALAKALTVFAADDAAKTRLIAAARELGVESN